MRAGAWLVVLLAGTIAGCAGTDGATPNPNFLSPKLVVHQRPDGNATVLVHGAFREHLYDWISIRVDNGTVANHTWVLSAERMVPSSGFFLEAQAQAGEVFYQAQVRVDLNATAEKARLSLLDAEGWQEPRTTGLPAEHIMDRPKVD